MSTRVEQEPLLSIWARRLVSIPLYTALACLLFGLAPLFLLPLGLVDLLAGDRHRWPRVRTLMFFGVYLGSEVVTVMLAGLLWLRCLGHPERVVPDHMTLQHWWGSVLFGGACRVFGMTLVVDLDQAVGFTGAAVAGGSGYLMAFAPLDKTKATVDPGHGGPDGGAVGPRGTKEKDVTMAIATKLARQMAAGGISVQLTRMRDVEVLLRPRVELANQQDSDLFISIHANSFPGNSKVAGIETYYFSDRALPLATAIHQRLVSSLKRPDRGVKRNNFYVVHHTKMPAALVEIGYISNPEEEALLTSAAYQERAAQAIYAGVKDYLARRQAL